MTWVLIGLAVVVVVAIIAVFAVGAALPENHRVEAERVIVADPQRVWQLISNPQEAPHWRSDLAPSKLR